MIKYQSSTDLLRDSNKENFTKIDNFHKSTIRFLLI